MSPPVIYIYISKVKNREILAFCGRNILNDPRRVESWNIWNWFLRVLVKHDFSLVETLKNNSNNWIEKWKWNRKNFNCKFK
jgi:hypothetical protein